MCWVCICSAECVWGGGATAAWRRAFFVAAQKVGGLGQGGVGVGGVGRGQIYI